MTKKMKQNNHFCFIVIDTISQLLKHIHNIVSVKIDYKNDCII